MSAIEALAEMESDDPELVPDILPVDARLSLSGEVAPLVKLLERAAAVTPVKEVITGTKYALLSAGTGSVSEASHVRITASDGEQTVSTIIDGIAVAVGGSVLIPAKRTLEILRMAPTTKVKIEVLGDAMTIRSGRALWRVQTPVGDSLNVVPDVDGIETQRVPSKAFLTALKVARAASVSPTRTPLQQVLVRAGALTGCEGTRLHRQKVEGLDPAIDVAIPNKVADEVIKALGQTHEAEFEFGYDDRHLVFRIGYDSIISQRLLLPYPNVESILLGSALKNQNRLTVSRGGLSSVVKRVRVNAHPDYSSVLLKLVPVRKDDHGEQVWALGVRAMDRQGNSAQEVIECQWAGAVPKQDFCLNHANLISVLDSYGGDSVTFRVGSDTKTERHAFYIDDPTTGFSAVAHQMISTFT